MNRALALLRRFNLSAVCFSLSVVTLGHTLQISNGFFDVLAVKWLTAALALCLIGGGLSRFTTALSRSSVAVVATILTAGILWQVQQHLVSERPVFFPTQAPLKFFYAGIIAQAVAVIAGLASARAMARFWFPTVLAAGLFLGTWMIWASPNPLIDVVVVHKEAITALLHDQDPYRITFENVYEPSDSAKFYNPAAVIGGRLAFAYPYPPPSLLFAVPGQLLFGDYRYAELALLVAAAGLIGYSRPGVVAKLAACILLTTPRVWFVIEQGWTEPIAIFLLALTVFLMMRHPIAAAWAVGIFVVTKQYLGFTGLSVVRFLFAEKKGWLWTGLSAALAAAAVTLPFALWHPHAFMRNVVWLQTQEPFRPDSLSYLAWAASQGIGRGSFVWAVGAAVVAAVLSLVATRNTAAGFATAVTLTTFTMFAFGSKAFCNYYFFVIGALCCAIAAIPLEERSDTLTVEG